MTVETNVIHTGDCMDVLSELPDNSVHAIVTDPPYGLNFMGRDWDNFRRKNNEDDAGRENVFGRTSSTSPAHGAETEGRNYQLWCENWARHAKRVLRPGGHMLAFSGNRTHHRLFSGVEDAGFEVRDTITWHYGSGFPKALDVSKAIQKQEGVEPESTEDASEHGMWSDDGDYNDVHNRHHYPDPEGDAEKWDGWKTTLKPATEFVVVARKPLGEDTVAGNVLEWGTGALNIGETRIGSEERTFEGVHDQRGGMVGGDNSVTKEQTVEGRYPSNVVFDEYAAEALDDDVGELDAPSSNSREDTGAMFEVGGHEKTEGYDDPGGPSRYFYTSKASRNERTLDGRIENAHPTVKPTDLMEWLVQLVTAKDQIVLDPFTGSGTTCMAAKNKNREFIGIEQQSKWADVARVRVGLTPDNPSVVREDDAQQGWEAYGTD